MRMRAGLQVVTALSVLGGAGHLDAQSFRVRVYHGAQGTTRAVSVEDADGERPTSRNRFSLTLPAGEQVCFEVENGHPVLYRYAVNQAVDTTSPKPPDFSAVLAQLNASLATRVPRGTAAVPFAARRSAFLDSLRGGDTLSWQDVYVFSMSLLIGDLRTFTEGVKRSDLPEPLPSAIRSASTDSLGYGYALHVMRSLPSGRFQFNDPNLSKSVETLNDGAREEAGSDAEKLTLELMSQRFASLIEQRDAVRSAYSSTSGMWSACAILEAGTNTLKLGAVSADPALGRARDTGSDLVSVVVTTEYVRPLLEVIPVALGVRQSGVAEVSITDSVLSLSRGSAFTPRAGTAIVLNAFRWGPQREISAGPFLGIGIGGEGKVLSDFYVGGSFAIRDWLQVGVAWGQSKVPFRLKEPYRVGQKVGQVEDLTELLESDFRDAVYVVFNILGLSLFDGS